MFLHCLFSERDGETIRTREVPIAIYRLELQLAMWKFLGNQSWTATTR